MRRVKDHIGATAGAGEPFLFALYILDLRFSHYDCILNEIRADGGDRAAHRSREAYNRVRRCSQQAVLYLPARVVIKKKGRARLSASEGLEGFLILRTFWPPQRFNRAARLNAADAFKHSASR
jgi:hypothetical protein